MARLALPDLLQGAGLLLESIRRQNALDGLSKYFGGRGSEHAFGAAVPTDDPALHVLADNCIIGRGHYRRQKRTNFLGLFPLGNVENHSGHANRLTGFVVKSFASGHQGMDRTIRPNHPKFGVKSRFFFESTFDSLRQGRAILGVDQLHEILKRAAKDASFGAKRGGSLLVPRPVPRHLVRLQVPIPRAGV